MTFSWNFCLKLHFSRYKHPTIRRIFGSVDENVDLGLSARPRTEVTNNKKISKKIISKYGDRPYDMARDCQ